ncbi:MAG: oligosaccharide flippase family protein [Magnetococcales bacterium]|nr:oligosaccharide flippase family protein [Magnetococcales bacterium]
MNERLAKNSLFSFLTMVAHLLMLSVQYIVVARYLTVEEFGEYSFIVAFVSSIMTLAHLGIQPIIVREIAVDRENAGLHFGQGLLIRVMGLTVGSGIVLVSALFLDLREQLLIALVIALAAEYLLGLAALGKGFFQAIERMEIETVIMAVYCLFYLSSIFSVFYWDLGFIAVFVAYFAANLLQTGHAYSLLLKRIKITLRWREMFSFFQHQESIIIGFAIFFRLNLPKVGILALRWLGEEADVAFFRAAQSIMLILEVLPAAFIMAMFPILSKLAHSGKGDFLGFFEKAFTLFFILSGGLFVLIVLAPHDIMWILYGDRYAPAAVALLIMSLMVFPIFLNPLLSAGLIVWRKQHHLIAAAGAAITISIFFYWLLIPDYGFLGAGIASVIGYNAYGLICIWLLGKLPVGITGRRFYGLAGKPMLAMGVMIGLGWLIEYHWPILTIPVAIVAVLGFYGLLFKMRVITLKEIIGFIRRKPLPPGGPPGKGAGPGGGEPPHERAKPQEGTKLPG